VRRRLHHVAVLGVVALLLGVRPAPAQDGLTIWSEFVRLVRTDGLTLDRIRPVAPMTDTRPAARPPGLRRRTRIMIPKAAMGR